MAEVERILRWIDSDEPKTVDELRRAAEELDGSAGAGRYAAATARLRIAVELERRGR